jgi:hypothetical protein
LNEALRLSCQKDAARGARKVRLEVAVLIQG